MLILGFKWLANKSPGKQFEQVYNVTVILSETTVKSPTTEELDALLKEAFQEPYVIALLKALKRLPATESLESKSEVNPVTLAQREHSNNAMRRVVLVSSALLVIGAILIFFRQKERSRTARAERLWGDNNVFLVPVR